MTMKLKDYILACDRLLACLEPSDPRYKKILCRQKTYTRQLAAIKLSKIKVSDEELQKKSRYPLKSLTLHYQYRRVFKGVKNIDIWIRSLKKLSPLNVVCKQRVIHPFEPANFQTECVNGKIYAKLGGRQFNLCNESTPKSFFLYAMNAFGQLYLAPTTKVDGIQITHDLMLGGEPVICAGEMQIDNGKIALIDCQSGRYRPNDSHLVNLLFELMRHEAFDLDSVQIVSKEFGLTPARAFIELNESERYTKLERTLGL